MLVSSEAVDLLGSCGIRLKGDACGAPGASNVIFLHGGGQSRSSWRGALRRMGEAGFRSYALDLRGHGESDWSPNGDYRIDRFVEDLFTAVTALGGPAVLVGASFGGHVALLTAALHPTLVQALVLCDVTPWIEGAITQAMRQIMLDASGGFDSAADASAHLARMGIVSANPDLERLKRRLRCGDDGRLYWRWDPRFFLSQESESGLLTQRLVSAASSVRAPTLVIRAENSEIVTLEQLACFRSVVPHATFADLAGARHIVTANDNDGYASLILNFMAPPLSR